ncbi:MAG: PP2C family protein-serine/threonine phosphatase [Candidatus Korobacteraceae bacterium]|jgi:sigma-B regulation protein RsbU (phosphoserine phosphatase)
MPFRIHPVELDKSAGPFRCALHYVSSALYYAYYDWTREMPRSKRLITWAGILMQGYAIYSFWARSLVWPVMWPKGIPLYASAWLLYIVGASLMNGMLTSEFFRKTQLEADQIAARQIQQTLQPEKLDPLPGYQVETFYKPFRDVGGDYFDVIALQDNRTLFTVADVSGKGMPAALLAANIQALVRSIANVEADPLALARQINQHLSRYTPIDRFATAVFVALNRDSGELTYVNAGHNAPIVFGSGSTTLLEATGMPLGLFADADYEARTAVIEPGGALLLFTDGLTDSISGTDPANRLCDAFANGSTRTMSSLKSLVEPTRNEDDITILLVKRSADCSSSAVFA